MMEESGAIVVFVTTDTAEEAQLISRMLLEQRKVACVNIVPKVDSLFWWQDELDSAQESLLVIKTKASLLNEIVNQIKAAHSYEVPEIIAMPIIGGNEEYLSWIDYEVEE